MVKFLLQRPIAVLMAFTACFIVGLVTYFSLPVSLLPDIAIPQITIQVTGENSSARELENTVVTPVRRQLLQVAGLREIKSETRDGAGVIRLEFDFGVNTDLAFIEVNEKIDAAMNSLPKEVTRPKAIKASATDIPVLYVNMTLKNDGAYQETDEQQFLELCELAENVVKRRIEQLPEVAMADITGVPGRLLQIVPDKDKLAMTGISVEDIENTLSANNVEPGSMLVRDGYYEYNIRIATLLRTPEDVKNIYIRKGERIMQLKELCKVDIVSQKEMGRSVAGGKRAVTLAIIKQSDENMDVMKEKLKETTDYFAITPMLSSSLTTIAVFVPLIFMSGIAGAIFMDQAFSITVGLMISYITGIMLLPVLYLLFYKVGIRSKGFLSRRFDNLLKNEWLESFYDKGIDWVFSHKKLCVTGTLATLPLCVFLFYVMEKERMPQIDQNELVARIEWNENIHVDENNRRVDDLMKQVDDRVTEHAAYVGMQDYILNGGSELSSTEAELYFKTEKPSGIYSLQELLEKEIREKYPLAVVTFSPPETIFEKLFVTGEADVVAELHTANKSQAPDAEHLQRLEKEITRVAGNVPTGIAFRNQMNLIINKEKLLLYNVSYDELTRVLRTAFKENKVSVLRSYQQYLPISIAGEEKSVNSVLSETLVRTMADGNGEVNHIPLNNLVTVVPAEDLKSITAGKNGEYIPLSFYDVKDAPELMRNVKEVVSEEKEWEVDFSGSFFSNEKMMGELTVILFVSLLLMYFILCAQFESFLQPLIVLMEIPIDTAFALLALWVFGHTLNLMSAIGIIVTCGIVVNDSILKMDAINELRKAGMPLVEAIHTAGRRRLRAIIMTSLTTVFAMVPLLFTSDMGSEMQKPLSIAMIGSMVVGTLVSLFIIPLIYWFIYRKHDKNEVH